MAYASRKKMTLKDAKAKARRKLGVLDTSTHIEGSNKLVLFHGLRGGHRATYNKTTHEFWFV